VAGGRPGDFADQQIRTTVVAGRPSERVLLIRVKNNRPGSTEPDLHSQLESLFDQVWRSEADWRSWDRVDAAMLIETLRAKRAGTLPEERAA
jgi:hypothetical protein